MAEWATEVRRDRRAWDDLGSWWNGQAAVKRSPFVHSRVLQCWADAYLDSERQLHVRVLTRRGEPVAALPLFNDRGRLRSLSQDQVDPFDLPVVPDDEVRERLPGWINQLSVAHLYRFDRRSPVVAALSDQPTWVLRRVLPSPYIDLSSGPEGARASLSSKSRSALRRKRRRLEERGEVTFVDQAVSGDSSGLLQAGLELEAAGWKGAEGTAVLKHPAREAFYRGLAEVAADERWLRLAGLYLDDRLVAFHYDLVYEGNRYLMLTTYDESEELSRFSLGTLLLEAVLEKSATEGLERFECGFGRAEWKERWATGSEPVFDLSVYGTGVLGRLIYRVKGRAHAQTVPPVEVVF